jgi:hypothetical protein
MHGAHNNIQPDHLGADVLFGKEFTLFFHLSRPRVELIIQKLWGSSNTFYYTFQSNQYGLIGPSLESKVLLPIKVLACGGAPHTFSDYFQMSISTGSRCCRMLYSNIPQLFGDD